LSVVMAGPLVERQRHMGMNRVGYRSSRCFTSNSFTPGSLHFSRGEFALEWAA
jgi:hypothetical protein